MPDEQFPIGRRIFLPGHFAEPVVLEAVRALGTGCECRVRLTDGSLEEVVLSQTEMEFFGDRDEKPEIARLVDPADMRLLVESARIRLAYAHDRQFAVSLSGIRTLPHQIEAVYQKVANRRSMPPAAMSWLRNSPTNAITCCCLPPRRTMATKTSSLIFCG